MALRKNLILAVSAAGIVFSAAAYAQAVPAAATDTTATATATTTDKAAAKPAKVEVKSHTKMEKKK